MEPLATTSIIKKDPRSFGEKFIFTGVAVLLALVLMAIFLPMIVEKSGQLLAGFTKGSSWKVTYQTIWPSYLKGELKLKGLKIEGPGIRLSIEEAVTHFDFEEFLKDQRLIHGLEEMRFKGVKLQFVSNQSTTPFKLPHLSLFPEKMMALKHSMMFTIDQFEMGEGLFQLKVPEAVFFVDGSDGLSLTVGSHFKVSEREVHGHWSLSNEVMKGNMKIYEHGKVIDDLVVSGNYQASTTNSQFKLAAISNDLVFQVTETEHQLKLNYDQKKVTLGYLLGWFGKKELTLSTLPSWLLTQWGSKITDDKNQCQITYQQLITEPGNQHLTQDLEGFRVQLNIFDPSGYENLVTTLSHAPLEPYLVKGNYQNLRGGLFFNLEKKSNAWGGQIYLNGLGFGAGKEQARIIVASQTNETTFRFEYLEREYWRPAFTTTLLEEANGRRMLVPRGNQAGLFLDLAERGDQIELTAEFDRFALKVPAEIINFPFLREAAVSGSLHYHFKKKDDYQLVSDLEFQHAITQEKLMTSRFDLDAESFRVRELMFPLGEQKLRLIGQGSSKPGDTKFTLAYSLGPSNQGMLNGESKGGGLSRTISLNAAPLVQNISVNLNFAEKVIGITIDGLNLGKTSLNITSQLFLKGGFLLKGHAALAGINPFDATSKLITDFTGNLGLLELTSLKYIDEQTTIAGLGAVSIKDKIIFKASFADLADKMTAEVAGELIGNEIRAGFTLKQFLPEKIKSPLQGVLKGNLRLLGELSGNLKSPTVNIRAFLENCPLPGGLYSLYTEVTRYKSDWEFQRLELAKPLDNNEREVVLRSSGRFASNGSWSAKIDLNRAPLLWSTSGLFEVHYDPQETKGEIYSEAYVLDGKTEVKSQTIFEKIDNNSGLSWVFHSPTGNGIEGSWQESRKNKLGKLSREKNIFLTYRQGREELFRVEGGEQDGKWDISLSTDRFRLGLLRPLLPIVVEEWGKSETFSVSEGAKGTRNVNLLLRLQNLTTGWSLSGKGLVTGKVKLIGQDGGLAPFRAELEIDDNRFVIKKGEVQFFDGTRFNVSGAILARSLRKIEEYDLHLISQGGGFPIQYETGVFNLKGKANIDAHLSGSGYYPKLSGKFNLSGTTIAIERASGKSQKSWEEKQRKFFNRIDWDLQIGASPGAKSRIESPLFDLAIDPNSSVNLKGSFYNDTYSFAGNIYAKSGTYTHLGSDFTIKNLVMTFPKNESGFNPFMDLTAALQVRDSDLGGNVEITLDKKSRVLDTESYSLSASPDRKLSEIKALLGLGDSKTGNSQGSQNKAVASSRLLAQNVLLRPIERSIRRTLGIDLFHIDTDLLSLANGTTNLPGSSVNTTVSFGKYLGENLFLQSDINFGLGKTNVLGGAIGLEYDLKYFNFGGKVQLNDFQQLDKATGNKAPVDVSIKLNKSWNF